MLGHTPSFRPEKKTARKRKERDGRKVKRNVKKREAKRGMSGQEKGGTKVTEGKVRRQYGARNSREGKQTVGRKKHEKKSYWRG